MEDLSLKLLKPRAPSDHNIQVEGTSTNGDLTTGGDDRSNCKSKRNMNFDLILCCLIF